ncbi:inactive pancreatic lipase-related protein 1-like [Venturia canescens]|uniref:inactive pancreatic lipase-related protein 1-like n=1 Tax=Venturia canescens TaxID=32260 RepID=UPI001C9D2AA3|nr:inactive pancreatic lipase-related protein 1-like [Venturia canescens]
MLVLLLVCSVLVISTLGSPAGADPIRTNIGGGFGEEKIQGDGNFAGGHRAPKTRPMDEEYAMFKEGLMMENDEGELVELTLGDEGGVIALENILSSNLDNRVFYRLYTRKNPKEYQPLWIDDQSSLSRSNFNADKPTHFVTHGWINSGDSPACTDIRDAYLKNGDFNVIVLDWSTFTLGPYGRAVLHVTQVGQHVAKMIDFLQSKARLDTKKTTLVGHSLGAHVMGLAGYYSKGTINYVVGLDPALPLFYFADEGHRISNKDANHVQIIHTNAGLLGYMSAIGHSDFYPNGGSMQLGCLLDVTGACSHARSWKFFAESINSQRGFYGKPCTSYLSYIIGRCTIGPVSMMGGSLIDLAGTGNYFLSTSAVAPFAKGP